MLIAKRIKAARTECKLTQQQVADVLGIDRSTYAYYKTGTNKPSIEILVRLAAIYNTEFSWLAGADRDKNSWNENEPELNIIAAVKEKQITDLSKNERKLVAIYRAAGQIDKDRDLISMLITVLKSDADD